jgi:putative aminopeptidase
MVFTHMDQLGFLRAQDRGGRADPGGTDGRRAGTRDGGAGGDVCVSARGATCPASSNKSHHATTPDEKYKVLTAPELTIDTGHGSKAAVEAAGVRIGTPVVYRPQWWRWTATGSPGPPWTTGRAAPCCWRWPAR